MSLPRCVDCAHYMPVLRWIRKEGDTNHAMTDTEVCNLLTPSLVTGKMEREVVYAESARHDNDLCGIRGMFFQSRQNYSIKKMKK